MADIDFRGDTLVVHIRGADKFWAMASRLEVPLQHISSVEQNPAEAREIWHGFRVGSNIPGVVTAGRFLQHGEWAFWDVHDPAQAIAIRLHDEGYGKLLIGVDDPAATAREINVRLGKIGAIG